MPDITAGDGAAGARHLGPGRESLEVLTCRQVGALRHVTFVAHDLAARTRPGQLVSLPPVSPAGVLRRGVPVAGVTATGPYGRTVELVVGPEDAGELTPGDRVDALGPLGRPVPLPRTPVPTVVVGIGRASGSAVWLAATLRERGAPVDVVLAAPTSTLLGDVAAARRIAGRLAVHTDDGTAGTSEDLGAVAGDAVERAGAEVVYAVGPLRRLLAVSDAAVLLGAVAQCVVDDPVLCVTGACGACAVPVVDRDGTTVLARPCVEGPALRGDLVRWDAVGPHGRRVPGDTAIGRRPR